MALTREEGHIDLFEQPVDGAQKRVRHGVGDGGVVSPAPPGGADGEGHHPPLLRRLDAVVVHPLAELRGHASSVHEHVQQAGSRAAAQQRHAAPGRHLDLEQALGERQGLIRELGDQAALGIRGHQDLLDGAVGARLAERDVPSLHVEHGARRAVRGDRPVGVPGVTRERVRATLRRLGGASDQPPRRGEQEHRGAQQLPDTAHESARILLGQQHLQQLLLQRHAPAQPVHVARRQGIEDVAGDLAKRRPLRHAQQRQLLAVRRRGHLRRDGANVGHDGHADAHHAALLQQLDESRRRGRIGLEARAGGEQQAPLDHPRRGVLDVADVDGLDRPVDPGVAGDHLEAEPPRGDELAERQGLD